MDILNGFRKHFPDFNFTTDIIVGFPGESEEDFAESVRMAREAAFSHIHTFRYSRRKGTRADRMKDQVPERIKSERSEVIRKVSEDNRIRYMQSMIGKAQRVLIEKVDRDGMAHGYGEHYLPVRFPAGEGTRNSFHKVRIAKVEPGESPFLRGVNQSFNP
jgi:threonylcarbamoyladenosine tRNA methylthiotransferase MtaB